ncbi:MAG: hypothetical protein JXR70_15285, partial [Spirochaetales bacterium]|nr:hypothetical protein [Spirochaetales bacterium]
VDMVKVNSSNWYRNSGNGSFVAVPWNFSGNSQTEPDISEEDLKAFNRTYYQQNPLRRWIVPVPGNIQVNSRANLVDPSQCMDGVSLETYHNNATLNELVLNQGINSDETEAALHVLEDDKIYLYLDPGTDERGDRVNWETQIKYSDIAYFNDMKLTALYQPPGSGRNSLPNDDDRLSPIYDESINGDNKEYDLKENWENHADKNVYDALVSGSYFIPRYINQELFMQIFEAANKNSIGGTSEQITLAKAYEFQSEWKRFVRKNNQGDQIILRLLPQFTNEEQRKDLAYYRLYDGRQVALVNQGKTYKNDQFFQNPDGIIYAETENYHPGSYVYQRGYLLDRIFDEEGVELSRLWIKNNQNNWEVNEQVITQSLDDIEIIENTNSSAKIRINDIQLEYQFSDLDSYIKDMPSDFYEDIVHHAVIDDRTFKLFDAHQITIELFQTAFERASIDEKTILTDNYILNETDNNYSLNQDIAESNLLIIHNLFDRIYSISESLFNEISPNEKIIISLSENEYNKLSQYYNERDRQNIDSAFLAITRNNVSYYIPAQNHQNISHNLAQYYRDIELFPYYELSGNRRTLIEIPETEDNEEIIAARDEYLTTFWNTLDIGIWKQAEKTLSISYDKILEVEESILPSGKSLLPLAPGVEDIPTGSDAGRVTFTGIDATGKTVIYQRYIPQFDSTTDFNTQNYNSMSPVFKQSGSGQATEKMDIPFDDFGGGYRGWYYNIYAGYYKFDTKYIGTFKKQDDKQRDPTPNYTLSAQPNYDDKTDNPLIENTGKKPTVSLNQDTWIGEISSYSKPQLDDYGHNEIIEYTFAPYITADEMAPCRKGGDSFYMAPQGATPFSGGQLGILNKSKSDSEDVSGGYSLSGIGGNLSANYGTSWQYAGLNDYNGDRYPDIILHKQDGSRDITFIPGSKNGFSSEEKITVPFDKLNLNNNATFGFGGSISSGSAGLDIKTDSEGNVISTSIVMGMGIGASANGTFGQGIQTNTLMDINGDSLPDYLSRDEFGDINVLLNTGIRSDWTNTNWTGGMDEKLGDWLYTMLDGTIVTGRSKGLSYSTNGSFGASVSVDFPIAVGVGAGASLGFTANCNKTYFRLVDINSDGLLDQVAKSPDDNYFRVRFNLGDRFSNETIKLFRPDWLNIKEEAIENAAKEDIQRIQGELSGIKLSGAELGSSNAVNFEGENQFEEVVKPLKIEDMLDYSSGAAFNIGANVRFSWELPLLVLEITPGVNGSIASTTTSLQFRDINGDSLPDHVMKRPGEDFVRVKSNHMGKAGLLKQIEIPFGGSINLEYQTEGNTINMPQNRFVLSKVTRNDHLKGPEDSIHSYSVEYQYEGGYYDRAERRFIGFEKVTTIQADYSKNEKIFYNRDLYKQGLMHFENNYDSTGSKISSVTCFYEPYSSYGLNNKESIFQALEQKDSIIYDNIGSEDIETREVFKYSTNGNIEDVFDYGSLHYEDDDYHLHIDYNKNLPDYRLSYPEAMVVYDSKDNILRKRTADYDKQGNPEIIKQYRQGNDYLEYAYKYDQYGNVELATNPANVVTKYIYDEIQNQFVTHIDVFPDNNPLQIYSSQMDWDYGLQTNTIRIDQNNNVETRKYDSFGRLTDLFSPYDDVNGIPA